jgi:hypothetical protein
MLRPFLLGLSLSFAFIGGVLFAEVIGAAHAAHSGRQRWEYFCVEKFNDTPEKLMEAFEAGGQKGWELAAAGEYMPVVVPTTGAQNYPVRPVVWCFKRPAP